MYKNDRGGGGHGGGSKNRSLGQTPLLESKFNYRFVLFDLKLWPVSCSHLFQKPNDVTNGHVKLRLNTPYFSHLRNPNRVAHFISFFLKMIFISYKK